MIKKIATSVSLAALLAVSANSATVTVDTNTNSGTAGTTSTVSTTLNVTVPPLVRISNMPNSGTIELDASDFNGINNPGQRIDAVMDFCVWSNVDTDGSFGIEPSGLSKTADHNGHQRFYLSGTTNPGEKLPFQLAIKAPNGAFTGFENKRNFDAGHPGSADFSGTSCTTNNMKLRFGVSYGDYTAVPADTYTGTVTITASTT